MKAKSPKPLSLYILTDGVWEGKSDPRKPIQKLVQTLVGWRMDKAQVGIQFINFGNDPVGLQRLQYLDFELGQELELYV